MEVSALIFVASFTDAWIETKARILKARKRESHLLQMRGLKLKSKDNRSFRALWSHLLQMRGLKLLCLLLMLLVRLVASFTDAWIETINDFRNVNAYQVASFTDAWIETELCWLRDYIVPVASFTDAWIETGIFGSIGAGRRSHLLQMRGLKLKLGRVLRI